MYCFLCILHENYIAMQTDYNAKYWKSKSVVRNAENKELKKRIEELKGSRDNWKNKYKVKSALAAKYEKEIGDIKKKIEKLL